MSTATRDLKICSLADALEVAERVIAWRALEAAARRHGDSVSVALADHAKRIADRLDERLSAYRGESVVAYA